MEFQTGFLKKAANFQTKWCIGKENTGHFTNLLVAGNLLRGIRGTSSLGRSQPNEEQREESLDQWFINIQCALACTDC